jgi:PKD repeat protein
VQFTDESTTNEGIISWSWTFKNMETNNELTSSNQNPQMTFTEVGPYNVTLSITCYDGSDSITKTSYITVNDCPCKARFKASPTQGCVPLQVQFTDQSDGATSWNWSFKNEGGDETFSTDQNPLITLSLTGWYTITLTIGCDGGQSDMKIRQDYIYVEDCACNADFYASDTIGCAPMTVTFTDDSQGAVAWSWSFPGGSPASASGQGPHVVTYNTPGRYDVSLDIECTGGSDVKVREDYIYVRDCGGDCNADFYASDTIGCAPMTTVFTDDSQSAISWLWEFPGGSPDMASGQGPHSVNYGAPGKYSVFLKITCETGRIDSTIKVDYIYVRDCGGDCNAGFYASDTIGCAPMTTVFTDDSQGAINWYWKFPAGSPSNANGQGPHTVTYGSPGKYSVSLKIQCETGQVDSTTKVDYIYVRDCGNEQFDYGDAPDPNYPTLLASNGARHLIDPVMYMGVAVDPDADGQPDGLSLGDDQNMLYPGVAYPPGDEDGVSMSPFIAPGQTVPVTIVVSAAGAVNAWLDFNLNGSWGDPGEHIIAAMPVNPGTNTFNFTVPSGAFTGLTHARFRYSSSRSLSYIGEAPDGEVEDYAVQITEPEDGSITIIKDATPEDNTIFVICTQLNSGFFNILCDMYMDPLNNTKTILNPSQIIDITESTIPGWNLTGITVTGDMDNGSTVDLTSGRVIMDFDPGENIVVTFKNEKPGEGEYDFGDAPDSPESPRYPTLLANNGARHVIEPNGPWLGNKGDFPDWDSNGQPTNSADGDDNDGNDDENGFNFATMNPITPDTLNEVILRYTANDTSYVNMWVDYNADGDWADANEHAIVDAIVYAPYTILSTFISVPASAKLGVTFARFRICSQRGLSFDGMAPDGEVEDYPVEISDDGGGRGKITIIKAATPPDSSQTFNFSGELGSFTLSPGSNSKTFNNLLPGNYKVIEALPSEWFLGNYQISGDADGGTTSDSVAATFYLDLDAGENISIVIYNYKGGKISVTKRTIPPGTGQFFNFLGDLGAMSLPDGSTFTQDSLQPGQYKITEAVTTGWQLSNIIVDDKNSTTDLPARTATVNVEAGETVNVVFTNTKEGESGIDFGDAPDPSYPTLLAANGAHHTVKPYMYLGSGIDPEPDGQPTANADGDDRNALYPGIPYTPGDEDGVTMAPLMTPGSTISVTIVASSSGAVNAWIDFNINGSWGDPGEHIIAAQPVNPGANVFSFTVPAGANTGATYARFRYSTTRNLSFAGPAPDGEVEDYKVAIQPRGEGSLKIIKDATPKDDTPFWISVVYGIHGGAAPYRDPSSNTAIISNAPAGTYQLGESVPGGWNLQDIVISGDSDNGSVKNVGAGTADIDLDPGESITVVFKNIEGGDIEYDLGDAPDGSNHFGLGMTAYAGVSAAFPTVYDPATGAKQGPRHRSPRERAWLGSKVSLEEDADIGADEDPTNNIDPQNDAPDLDYCDDGVNIPLYLPDCGLTTFNYTVTATATGAQQDYYVNVWFDWNRDGDWKDDVTCNGMTLPEWTIQNQGISVSAGTQVLTTPQFRSFHPPFTGSPHPIWMRITLSPRPASEKDGSGPADGYNSGETEDYFFVPRLTEEGEYDFGDAPDTPNEVEYQTLHHHGGAYHTILPGFHLGWSVDKDVNGQPTPSADGDDNDGNDDEDGIIFLTPFVLGQQANVEVIASANGILNAWFDFNQNKTWTDAGEHVFVNVPVAAGSQVVTFNVPATAAPGVTFARFRYSRMQGLLSAGYGQEGEVEDYILEISKHEPGPPIKWMQIPLLNENPDMPYTPSFFGWDERSIYEDVVIADDWFCKSPRPVTGVRWWGSYVNWDSVRPPENAPHAFHIGIWTDIPAGEQKPWSQPGTLVHEWGVPREMLGEHAVGDDFFQDRMEKPDTCFQYDFEIPQSEWFWQEGDSTIYWLSIAAIYETIPDEHFWGWKTRLHYFHDDAVRIYNPNAPDVGNQAIETEPVLDLWDMAYMLFTDEYFIEFDFGDAPAERYLTFLAQNGAQHILHPHVFLGASADPDDDGQSHPSAMGDDSDGNDDDDGIVFLSGPQPGNPATVKVTASTNGYLNGWMDFNNNGSWFDPDERVFHHQALAPGDNTLTIQIPANAVSTPVFSRFRFSTEPGIHVFGLAIDGEVEDYLVEMRTIDVGEDPAGSLPGEYRLMQNYPNPFNLSTEIRFDVPENGMVRLTIYNLVGEMLRAIVNGQRSAGHHSAHWDGRNENGESLASGIYLLTMQAGRFKATKKIILLK